MPKSDKDFVNSSQDHELKDWLYRNGFSKKEENITELKVIIKEKVKNGDSSQNITWKDLDSALEEKSEWFDKLSVVDE